MKNIKQKLKDNLYIELVALVYAAIYLYRMFTNFPWYDELYTYYSFISKGPIYAAIHWPLPNNHMGYSAISGFLTYLGNSTIALRGVSFVCAVSNVFLVYYLAKKWTGVKAAFLAVFVYCGAFNVHNMAVQGRGYTFSTTLYIIALLMLDKMFDNIAKRRDYVVYVICLAYSIYTVPSSTFWVIPVCIFGGMYLLTNKRIRDLVRLIVISVVAAVFAGFSYLLVWLAIGANLLCKNAETAYFGMGQFSVIKAAPVLSAKTGLDYMLASPYIQSMDRGVVVNGLFDYFEALFEQFFGGFGIEITIFLAISAIVAIVRFVMNRQKRLELYVAVSVIMLPIMLILQSVQPYLRVFSFFGLAIAMSVVMYISIAGQLISKSKAVADNMKRLDVATGIATAIAGICFIGLLFSNTYTAPMAGKENDIKEAWDEAVAAGVDIKSVDSICYTDDYQRYVLKYYYGIDPAEGVLGEAKYVMVSQSMRNEEETSIIWPMLYSYETFDFEQLEAKYKQAATTEQYTIYVKE